MTDIRENLLRNLLRKIAADHKYDNPDIQTGLVSTAGANFSSQLFYATIRAEKKEDLNVFAKVACLGEASREATTSNIYDIENYFYTNLVKAYEQIEDIHDVPEENRLVTPKFYGYSDDYMKEVLVLQDLSKDGFLIHDRLTSINWEYASVAVEQMAKLHALSIAYKSEYPENYEKSLNVLDRRISAESSFVNDLFKRNIEKMIPMIKEENKLKLIKFIETFNRKKFVEFCKPQKKSVIIHGDFKPSNLLHKIDENGQVKMVVVDYQTVYPGRVTTDLLYFIFTGSDGAFREKHYDQLIEHYYKNLAAALRRLDLEPEEAFPRKDFDEELKEMLPYGLMISVTHLPLITVDLAHVAKGGEFENSYTMAKILGDINALCMRRFNEVIDDYVKWGVL